MTVKKDMHYFHTERTEGKKGFGPSVTKPNQGFRMKELIARMTAGAPPPVGRSTVYVDPKYGVDPLARYDVPIEEMAQIAENAKKRIKEIEQERETYAQNLEHPPTPPAIPPGTPPAIPPGTPPAIPPGTPPA